MHDITAKQGGARPRNSTNHCPRPQARSPNNKPLSRSTEFFWNYNKSLNKILKIQNSTKLHIFRQNVEHGYITLTKLLHSQAREVRRQEHTIPSLYNIIGENLHI